MSRLLLASRSESRARLLRAALVPFETVNAGVDEEAARDALDAEGVSPRNLADALAELKAVRPSLRRGEDLVLGCDQTLELEDGSRVDKVETREEAAEVLARMSDRPHRLHSAAVVGADVGTVDAGIGHDEAVAMLDNQSALVAAQDVDGFGEDHFH